MNDTQLDAETSRDLIAIQEYSQSKIEYQDVNSKSIKRKKMK